MSFSEDLSILHGDYFEGSTDEIQISQEVLYGIDSAGGGKSCKLSGFFNFGLQPHKFVESPPSPNTVAVTSESSSKVFLKEGNVHGGALRTCPSVPFTEGDHTVPVKRMKLSADELSSTKPFMQASEVQLKADYSGIDHPKSHLDNQFVMYHVVESSSEGVRSSCYLLKNGFETEQKGCLLDIVHPKDYSLFSEGTEGKEIVVSNTMASPVSQESCVTKMLVTSPAITNVGNTGSCQRVVKKRKTGTPFELGNDDIPWTGGSTKEYRPFLRQRILHFFAAAGWTFEKRKRPCRSYEELVFLSPENRPVRELAKAWIVCGQILQAHRYKQVEAGGGRQWTSVDQLCSDLHCTLKYIDKELKHLETKVALAHQWVLLNPFVTLIFVERKIKQLRAGNVVGAKHNACDTGEKLAAVGKGETSNNGCTMPKLCDSFLAIESAVIDSDTPSQGGKVVASTSRSVYISEGSSMRLLETVDKMKGHSADTGMNDSRHQQSSFPDQDSNITLLLPASDPYGVPVDSENVDLTYGVSQEFSGHRYDACDVVMHEPNQLRAEDAEYRQCFGSCSLRNSMTDGCLVSKSKGKPKKSEMMAKIETTSFSEDEMLNLSTPSRVEDDTQKMNEHTNGAKDKSCKRRSSSTKSCKKRNTKRKSLHCQLKDDDLLISAIVQKKKFRSKSNKRNVKADNKVRRPKKRKNHKSGCRLLPRNLSKGGRHFPDERWTLKAERMVLSWLLHTGAVILNEIIQFRDLKDETMVKDGLITRDGILCRCCNKVFSISAFKVHAGLETRDLCLNFFVGSGQPFSTRLLEAWSAEYKTRKAGLRAVKSDEFDQNDDSCGLCGDGGELLCCDNCPSTFHQSCLSAEELPEGSWYCTSCTCWICGDLVDEEGSGEQCGFKCFQCEHKYHLLCLKELGLDRISSNSLFCSASCEEVHSGLQSHIGLCNLIADGFSWSVLRCIQDEQEVHSTQQLALKAECNSKLAVALTIMEECFVSMVDSRTGIDMIPQVVYNWGSEFPRLDYHGFYTMVLEKGDVLLSVASVRVHGVEVAEMPLVATCGKYRRKGMCRRLLCAVEQMLVSFKVKKLVIAAIPDLVETWTVGFGFVPVEEEEKKSLNKMNLMVFPGTIMLKKILYHGQPTDIQGAGPAGAESPVGIHKCITEGASLGKQCENDERYSSGGLTNVKSARSHGMEVVEVQRLSPDSQKKESVVDTERTASGDCMSLEVCGHTEIRDCLDRSPQKETNEDVGDMHMQASYVDIFTRATVDRTSDTYNNPENRKSQEPLFLHEGVSHEKTQHEVSFRVSSEVQKQTTPSVSLDDVGECREQGRGGSEVAGGVIANITNYFLSNAEGNNCEVSFSDGDELDRAFDCSIPRELADRRMQREEGFHVESEIESNINISPFSQKGALHERKQTGMSSGFASEVDSKVVNPLVPCEYTGWEKGLREITTSDVHKEREYGNMNSPLSQEGAMLNQTLQVVGGVPGEFEIKMPNITGIIAEREAVTGVDEADQTPQVDQEEVAITGIIAEREAVIGVDEADQTPQVDQEEVAITGVGEVESKNKILVLLEEVHSVNADQLPTSFPNGEVNDMVIITNTDTMTEYTLGASQEVQAADEKNKNMPGQVCQSINTPCTSSSEPGKRLETQFATEQEPQDPSSPKNSSHPCSSVALEAQPESVSNAKLQLV